MVGGKYGLAPCKILSFQQIFLISIEFQGVNKVEVKLAVISCWNITGLKWFLIISLIENQFNLILLFALYNIVKLCMLLTID